MNSNKKLKSFKEEKIHWILFIFFCLVYFTFDNLSYKEYIMNNNIYDYGISENGTNFFGVFALYAFFFLVISYKEKSFLKHCIKISGILVLYEFIQIILPTQTFDWNDILSTVIASIVGYFLLYFINKSV